MSRNKNFLFRIDPLSKLLWTLAGIFAVTTVPLSFYPFFIFYGIAVLVLAVSARIPPLSIFKRLIIVLPFLLIPVVSLPFYSSTETGLMTLRTIFTRAILSLATVILFSSTTSFPELLKRLEEKRLSGVLATTLNLTYRYLFLLGEEMLRLRRSVESRSPSLRSRKVLKAMSGGVGLLFLRSLERAERVYEAMLSRGYGLNNENGRNDD